MCVLFENHKSRGELSNLCSIPTEAESMCVCLGLLCAMAQKVLSPVLLWGAYYISVSLGFTGASYQIYAELRHPVQIIWHYVQGL